MTKAEIIEADRKVVIPSYFLDAMGQLWRGPIAPEENLHYARFEGANDDGSPCWVLRRSERASNWLEIAATLPDYTGSCWPWDRFWKRLHNIMTHDGHVFPSMSHVGQAYQEMLADCSVHNPTRLYGTDAVKAAEELNELENQVEAKEINLQQARSDIDCLNRMLRETGYGQGQIDAYVSQCEEVDDLKKKLADLTAQAEDAEIMEGVSVKNMKEMRGGPANDPLVG